MTHQRMMVADGDKLQRVLLNILENACQAIGGRGRVWIKSRDVKLNQHAYVEICLGNDGPLIAPGELPHVFEAFYTKGKRQGTGLGLAIARKAIEDQNGKITCRSKLDTGTEFVLHIPAAEAIDVNAGRAFDLPQVAAPIASTSSVVALIEDDPFLLDAWVKTMTDATLVTFASPDEWAAAVATKPAWLERLAVVVTDLCFSSDVEAGTDAGLELIRALKADRPQVPVLISSELAATLELNGVPSIAKRAHRYKELQTYLPSDSSSLPVAPAPKFS
jgi:CheY-like chemotaxis protein